MVFAHGFGCDQNMWRYVAPRFEDDFRVVLFDHVGAGGSDLVGVRPGALLVARRATPTTCWRSAASSTCATSIFVGHSVSAMIGALAALEEPERFAKLVLVGPSPRYIDDGAYVGGFSEEDIDELLDSLESNYLGWSSAMAPVIMGNPDRPELGRGAHRELLPDRPGDRPPVRPGHVPLRQPRRPRRGHDPDARPAVHQRRDRPGRGRRVRHATRCPNSSLVLLDATGHCPNLSAPDETAAAIAAFVRG